MMRVRLSIFLALVLMLALPVPFAAADDAGSPTYVATYFLTNIRCPSCVTIERLSSETILEEFSGQIDSGLLTWRTVNIDEDGNYHYVKDYGLYTKSVIISEQVNGKEIRWKNLPKVWEYIGNEGKFRQYIVEEITAFMAGK